jgi:BMFP domain-containing protein YqiC
MPITAKLSRNFYDRFGDDVVNELVDWLNSVDLSYRQEFKDLFEANFARLETRIDGFEHRLAATEQRLELRVAQCRAELDARIARSEGRLIAWSFGFWLAQLGAMAGLLKLAGLL